jgi:uncharacterized membrane protein
MTFLARLGSLARIGFTMGFVKPAYQFQASLAQHDNAGPIRHQTVGRRGDCHASPASSRLQQITYNDKSTGPAFPVRSARVAERIGVEACCVGERRTGKHPCIRRKRSAIIAVSVVVVLISSVADLTLRSKAVADRPPREVPERQVQSSSSGSRHGLFASAAWGAFFGSVLGALLGATFILLWFSVAYSPFSPKDWGASVTVETQRGAAVRRERTVAVTDHPVALFAFGLPVVLGAVSGAVFGAVVGVSDVE